MQDALRGGSVDSRFGDDAMHTLLLQRPSAKGGNGFCHISVVFERFPQTVADLDDALRVGAPLEEGRTHHHAVGFADDKPKGVPLRIICVLLRSGPLTSDDLPENAIERFREIGAAELALQPWHIVEPQARLPWVRSTIPAWVFQVLCAVFRAGYKRKAGTLCGGSGIPL